MAVLLEFIFDDLQVDEVSPPNGDFELGASTNWDIYCDDGFTFSVTNQKHSGNYGGYITYNSYQSEPYAECVITYENLDSTNANTVSLWFFIPYFTCDEYSRFRLEITARTNSQSHIKELYFYDTASGEYLPQYTWVNASADISDFNDEQFYIKIRLDKEPIPANVILYIDDITTENFGLTINQQLYLRHQYDYEMRALDNGLIVDNNLQYSHRLTDKGQFIDFDYVDMPSKGLLRKIKYILNTLYMRIRGIV